jgi:hypothetical protein
VSTLIDNLIGYATVNQEINGKWYIAKPYDISSFKERLKDAYRVLIGKSQAYHFKEDEVN